MPSYTSTPALTFGLAGRGVVVTGGTGAIGREVASLFARAGASVAVVDQDLRVCESVADKLAGAPRHIGVSADIRDTAALDALLEDIQQRLGRFDVLVNLAAVLRRRPSVDDVTEEDWDLQLDTNLKAAFFLNRAAFRMFRAQGCPGRIINFASQGWATGGFGGSVVYAASKGGLVSMTRGLARTMAPSNVTVNAVAPGGVDTPMMLDGQSAEDLATFIALIPAGRLGHASEMAGIVLFLASPYASYITGATISVSGGQLMH